MMEMANGDYPPQESFAVDGGNFHGVGDDEAPHIPSILSTPPDMS